MIGETLALKLLAIHTWQHSAVIAWQLPAISYNVHCQAMPVRCRIHLQQPLTLWQVCSTVRSLLKSNNITDVLVT
jgi:hypothetical protein